MVGGAVQEDSNGNQKIIGGDIITAIDGKLLKRIDDLISYIDGQKSVGDKVKLTVYRDGKRTDLIATITARPATTTNSSQLNYSSANNNKIQVITTIMTCLPIYQDFQTFHNFPNYPYFLFGTIFKYKLLFIK